MPIYSLTRSGPVAVSHVDDVPDGGAALVLADGAAITEPLDALVRDLVSTPLLVAAQGTVGTRLRTAEQLARAPSTSHEEAAASSMFLAVSVADREAARLLYEWDDAARDPATLVILVAQSRFTPRPVTYGIRRV